MAAASVNYKNITCGHCKKTGQPEENCQVKNPSKVPEWAKKLQKNKREATASAKTEVVVSVVLGRLDGDPTSLMEMETSPNNLTSLMEMKISPSTQAKWMTDAYPVELDMSEEDKDGATKLTNDFNNFNKIEAMQLTASEEFEFMAKEMGSDKSIGKRKNETGMLVTAHAIPRGHQHA